MGTPGFFGKKKEDILRRDMDRLGIKENDIEECFVHSAGPGGQNVNKTATCVLLRHIPSGIIVKCQKTRSQGLNRMFARRILIDKLDARINARLSKERQRIARIKRQKRKRSKRAKEKLRILKQRRAEKKQQRGAVSSDDH